MKIITTAANRKEVVKVVSELMNTKAVYLGPPTFAYQIGAFIVDREGAVETKYQDIGQTMKQELVNRGFAEEDSDSLEINLPLELHTGTSLKNLIFLIHSKQLLINKAVGRTVFDIKEEFITTLAQTELNSVNTFQAVLKSNPGMVSGLRLTKENIIFDGFPFDTERIRAFMEFTSGLAQTAILQKRVSPKETKVENEKYYMRVWLLRLGLGGSDGKEARKVFLKNLSGHTAFRTEEEKERAKEKSKAEREE